MRATGLLVGRDAELAALERSLDGVEGDGASAVGIVGEPGIGKSRLLGEWPRTGSRCIYCIASRAGSRTAWSRCIARLRARAGGRARCRGQLPAAGSRGTAVERAAAGCRASCAALRAGEAELGIEQLHVAVQDLGDPGARARAANTLGSALFQAYRGPDAVAALTTVIDELPDSEREHGLQLQATRWIGAMGSVAAWRTVRSMPARFVVTESSARTTGERLQLAVAYDAARARTAAEARELSLRALAHGRLLDDPGPDSAGFWGPPVGLLLAHALAELTTVCDEVVEWAQRHGSLPAFSIAMQLRAYAWWRRGSLAEAEADATSALEHPVVPGMPPWGREALANVLLARGDHDRAEAARPPAPSELTGVRALWHLDTRARVRAASQRAEEALDDLFACGRLEHGWEIHTPAFCGWRADAAVLLASLGRGEQADRLARDELARCRAFGASIPLGAALRSLGVVTQRAAGIALLEQAVAVLEDSSARLEHALALLELGAAVRREGRPADARGPLREALELARRCGASAVAARAHHELVAAGARPRRDPTGGGHTLTAGELRVARMAAGGMTNREIAQALFVTENTIRTHLKSVFRKLAIGSRSQLARAL